MLAGLILIFIEVCTLLIWSPEGTISKAEIIGTPAYGALLLLGLAFLLNRSGFFFWRGDQRPFLKVFLALSLGVVSYHILHLLSLSNGGSTTEPILGLNYSQWQSMALGGWVHILGFAVRDVPPNPLIGFQKNASFETWQKSQRLGARIWIIAGFATILAGWFLREGALWFGLASFFAGGIWPAIAASAVPQNKTGQS